MKGKIEIYFEMPLLADYLQLSGKKLSEKDVRGAIEPLIHQAVEFHLNNCSPLISGTVREMLINQPITPNSRETFRMLPSECLYIFFKEDEEEMQKMSKVTRNKKKQVFALMRHNGCTYKKCRHVGHHVDMMTLFDRARMAYPREYLKSVSNKIEKQEAPKATCKVIFLDLDGVLNTEDYFTHLRNNGLETTDYFGNLFSPTAVANLQQIIDATNAQIVISSSWRFAGMDVLKTMWKKRQLPGNIYDITSLYVTDDFISEHMHDENFDYNEVISSPRGIEISSWLQDHPEAISFVILDDLTSMKQFQESYVQINPKTGITSENAKQAIEILNT